MARHNELGVEGEDEAVAHLEKIGYEILERNVETMHGELDVVAVDNGGRRRKCLVFVEVRTRTDWDMGNPAETVSRPKQRKLARAATGYLMAHPELPDMDVRFDVIGVDLSTGAPRIDHVQQAFYLDH
jgi:putative endonuclease